MLIYNLIDIIYILSEKDMSIELRTINILRLYHYIYMHCLRISDFHTYHLCDKYRSASRAARHPLAAAFIA